LDGWQGFSEVNTGYKIGSDGVISKWEYQAGSASGVILQVWRFVSGTNYKLIGQNTVDSSVNGKIKVVEVESGSQIEVKAGDYIGWTFIGQAAFGFSSTQGTTRWSTGSGVAYKTTGKDFSFPGTGKRLYQCRAYIGAGKVAAPTAAPAKVEVVPPPLESAFEAKWGLDGWQGFSEVNTGYKIGSDGVISKWEYQAGSASGVILQVWRFVSGTNYKLIGQNTVDSSVNGKIKVVEVESGSQIEVKAGDYIGWTFIGQAAFGFSSTQGTTRWSTGSGVAYKTTGKDFSFPGTGQRLYQCRAYISGVKKSLIALNGTSSSQSLIAVNGTFTNATSYN